MIRLRLVSSHLFRDACKSLSSLFSGGHCPINLYNRVVLSIRDLASSLSTDNYHETNPDSKEESILINKEEKEAAKKEKEAVKKAREAFLLDKFEAWSKKYGRTYSSKKDECFWFLVFEDNYESMNTKKNDLPPKDLVMPDYRRYLGGLFKYIDENSPTGNFGHPSPR